MKAYVFDVEFLWGFQSRVAGLSKSPPSYLFPPPTSVLGALAERLARKLKFGEMDGVRLIIELSRDLVAISFRPINAFPISYMTLSRVIAIGQRGGVSYPTSQDVHVYKSFDAPAKGSTLLGSIDGQPPRIRYYIVFRGGERLSPDDIWAIRRIGSRESPVAVVNVWEAKIAGTDKEGFVYTAVPEDRGVTILSGSSGSFREYYVDPYVLTDSPAKTLLMNPSQVKPFLVPVPEISGVQSPLYVSVEGGRYVIYTVIYEGQEEKVVGLAT
ncbi:hypothetical protein [Infirmifilum sp.]|uniref:hypothetical protein n=1 Tax=Infirmifilum sp. TaxID=2856575 RepID=UPI003D0B4703